MESASPAAIADNLIHYLDSEQEGQPSLFPKISEMESCDRPYEKAEAHGMSTLSNADLLAVILRSGMPGLPVTHICRRMLASSDGGFQQLFRLSAEQLREFPGVGKVKAMQIQAIFEILKRYIREPIGANPVINTPEVLARLMMSRLVGETVEHIFLIALSQSLRLMGVHEISRGTATSSVYDVKQILRKAILTDAQAVMLCHNHPSGNMTPSTQDDKLTRSLSEGCRAVNLRFLDHVIVGGGTPEKPTYYSYRDEGKL